MQSITRRLRSIGLDRAIAYTVFGRAWSALAGPVMLLLIARFLTGEAQGYYFTFGNVLGLQVLFELGLAFVIFQFASHEKAKLEWTEAGTIEGDPDAKDRLFSLLRKAFIWYAWVAVLVFTVMLPGGILFFRQHHETHGHVAWLIPWVWVVTVTAADLLACPIRAVVEGSGLVSEVALVSTYQLVVGSLLTWAALLMRAGLLAAPVSNTVVFIGWWVWLGFKRRAFLRQAITYVPHRGAIDWRREVWPFQWKIALSGISSYFIFLIFTPILFMFKGAVVAGQMGMSAAVMAAVSMIAVAWVSTKMSPLGSLIAQRDFRGLDELFFPSLWQSLGVLVSLGGLFWLGVAALNVMHVPLSQRLLGPVPLLWLLGTTVANHIVGVEAMYLRAHKQEPFLVLSIVVGLLTAVTTYLLARHGSVSEMLAGNFAITSIFSLGWGTWIFIRKREIWHFEDLAIAEKTHVTQIQF